MSRDGTATLPSSCPFTGKVVLKVISISEALSVKLESFKIKRILFNIGIVVLAGVTLATLFRLLSSKFWLTENCIFYLLTFNIFITRFYQRILFFPSNLKQIIKSNFYILSDFELLKY
jgi:hypothetical protein